MLARRLRQAPFGAYGCNFTSSAGAGWRAILHSLPPGATVPGWAPSCSMAPAPSRASPQISTATARAWSARSRLWACAALIRRASWSSSRWKACDASRSRPRSISGQWPGRRTGSSRRTPRPRSSCSRSWTLRCPSPTASAPASPASGGRARRSRRPRRRRPATTPFGARRARGQGEGLR
jgi:hypothetical protein